MNKLSTLIATYRSTVKPRKRWSKSKDYMLDALIADLGHWKLSRVKRKNLVAWAMTTARAASVVKSMLATLSEVLKTGALLFQAPVKATAAQKALSALSAAQVVKPSNTRQRRVSDAELEIIFNAWSGKTPPIAIYILRETAMRSGELCKLLWADVNLQGSTAIIRARKDPTRSTDNDQEIPLLGDAPRHMATLPRTSDRVLPVSQQVLYSQFKRAAQRAKVHNICLHDLRHEGISRLFEKGWSIPQVAAVSGHRKWETLKRYTHISPTTLLGLQ